MRETLSFSIDLLLRPSKALERLRLPEAALTESLRLYLAFILASALFYAWKPEGFPPPSLDMPLPAPGPGSRGLLFWTKVQLWEPFLSGIWIVFLAAFSGFFRSSFASLPAQIALGGFAGVLPVVPLLLYKKGAITGSAFALFWLVLLGLFYPFLRRRTPSAWKSLASLALALNVIDLAFLPPACLSVVLNLPTAYYAVHYGVLFWTLGLGAYLLAELDGISTARACVALLLSLTWQLLFVFSLHLSGLVSKDILKAMMSL